MEVINLFSRFLDTLHFQPLLTLLLIIGIACGVFLPLGWGLLLLAAEILLLSVSMKPGPLIRYLTLPLQVLTGWNHYSPDYRPAVKSGNKDNNQSPNESIIQ